MSGCWLPPVEVVGVEFVAVEVEGDTNCVSGMVKVGLFGGSGCT